MRFYLLTIFGKLLGRRVGQTEVSQIDWVSGIDRSLLACVDLEADFARSTYKDFIASSKGLTQKRHVRHLGDRIMHSNPSTRTVSIERGGFFLCPVPDGSIQEDRTSAGAWEALLPCSDDDLDLLDKLSMSRWILKSDRSMIVGASMKLGDQYSIEIGHIRIPLRFNFPFDRRAYPFRLVILLEGWRIDELILFNPMIYYLAFGQEHVFQQLNLSLQSLAQVGRYDGHVLVFTDRTKAEITKEAPWLPPEKIDVSYIPATEWVGFVAGKYCIVEEEKSHSHQPVVYMDPDIIYNTDVKSFLIEMAVSDRITSPLELFSGLEHAPSVGATLLQLDHAQPRFACGFNCGTIGIPNIPAHKHTLLLIRQIITNFLDIRGREAFRWVDQEAANYVSYKIAHFDTNHISRCVRYGFEHTKTPLEPRSGLVHFWGVDRRRRPEIMKEYLDLVLEQDRLFETIATQSSPGPKKDDEPSANASG
jgi:hypothetical protein